MVNGIGYNLSLDVLNDIADIFIVKAYDSTALFLDLVNVLGKGLDDVGNSRWYDLLKLKHNMKDG